MARFYVPHPQIENGILRVEGDEVRHIRKVLRLREGDEVFIFDGLGKEYEGTIVEEGPFSVSILVRTILSSKKESTLEITLAQSLLKGEKMDYLVQKATELGVKRIVPFMSFRSVPLLENSKRLERRRRWEKIAIEASKQCGRGVLPKIDPLKDYPQILETVPVESLKLILWEKGGKKLKEILKELERENRIFFIVGPEGGLRKEEVEEAKKAGFVPVTLGERILRSETASLCFVSILQYEWGDIG
ncbi:MAG TPA: 16S rRNA (uracil(1498)-N(3))-methyltransferase [Thermodesulfobacteriota bacterium]|nr:16S rRNA (uracil(1498)-N(3))-methyltransferase [Thermodesulfobacteriota bacterium]